jgi:FPC/CPF motif-containing protein YcgG
MDVPITVAIISAAAAIVVPAFSFYLTKSKERQADWQRYKFELYKELVQSFSGIVGTDSTPEGNKRFAAACNTLHLIASKGVLDALHDFQDEIRASNANHSDERHDSLLSRLEWEIREDLLIPHNPTLKQFNARLWCSGASENKNSG